MVINDFNVKGIAIVPFKANPPLFIYFDAALTFPIAFQQLQMVCRRNSQVVYYACPVQHAELSKSHALNIIRKLRKDPAKYLFGLFAFERLDHGTNNSPYNA
jgi:hypothetical protein